MPFEVEFWHWWVLAIVLIGIEIFVTTTVFMWTAAGAVVVGAAMLAAPSFAWQYQALVFAVVSVATALAWRKWAPRGNEESVDPSINRRGAEYVGQTFALPQPISNGRGQLMIDGIAWRIVGPDLPEQTPVKVTAVEGAVLRVDATGG